MKFIGFILVLAGLNAINHFYIYEGFPIKWDTIVMIIVGIIMMLPNPFGGRDGKRK